MTHRQTVRYEKIYDQKGLGESSEISVKYVDDKFQAVYLQYKMVDEFRIGGLKDLERLIEMLNEARCMIKCSK